MKVIFTYRPYSLFSWLIRLFTFSKFSHVALMLSSEYIVDATFKHGVKISTTEEFLKQYPLSRQTIVDIDIPNSSDTIGFILKQLGKPYDWTAIVGIVTQRNWQEDDSWFCSELIEAAIKSGGLDRFREDVSRVTPNMCWSIK